MNKSDDYISVTAAKLAEQLKSMRGAAVQLSIAIQDLKFCLHQLELNAIELQTAEIIKNAKKLEVDE